MLLSLHVAYDSEIWLCRPHIIPPNAVSKLPSSYTELFSPWPSGVSICSHFLLHVIRTPFRVLLPTFFLPFLVSIGALPCDPRILFLARHVILLGRSVISVSAHFIADILRLLRHGHRIVPWCFYPVGVSIKTCSGDYMLSRIWIGSSRKFQSVSLFSHLLKQYLRTCSLPWLHEYYSTYCLALVFLLAPPGCISAPLPISNGSNRFGFGIHSFNDRQAVSVHDSRSNVHSSYVRPSVSTSESETRFSRSTHIISTGLYHPIDNRSPDRQNGSVQTSTQPQLATKQNRIPVMLIIILVVVCTSILLLLLAFWCTYERRNRHKIVSTKQARIISLQYSSVEHGNASKAPEPTPAGPVHEAVESNEITVHRICIPFTQCLQRWLRPLSRADSSHVETESVVYHDDSSTSWNLPFPSHFKESPPLASKAPNLSHPKPSAANPSVSGSPSLAHRRRGTPLPRLITPITSSPLIETCTVLVQPTDTLSFSVQPYEKTVESLVKPKCVPHFDSDSVFRSPTVHAALDIMQSSFDLPQNLRDTLGQAHVSPLIHSATSCASKTSCSIQVGHSVGGPHAPRNRAKGLLESRRGSHTSLTLCLSPLTNLAHSTGVINRGGFSLGVDSNLGSTADHTCTSYCHPHSLCYSSRSPCSEVKSMDYFESCPANSSTDSDVIHQVAQLDLSHPRTPLEPRTCERLNLPVPRLSKCCNSCHHNHRYAHLHSIHSPYHRLCSHHHFRVDRTSGPLSCQRSRELEQLMNASAPLTHEDLILKLRSNTSALFQEFWDIPMNHTNKRELPLAGIGHKNRYQSILPNFSTRVVLPMINNDCTTTYINANYITGYEGRPNAFIATQGPMSHTICDFWRMIWHTGAPAIVMITKLVEKQGVKCELYLPNTSPNNASTDRSTLVSSKISIDNSAHSSGFADSMSFVSPDASCSSTSPLELDQRQLDSGTASIAEHIDDSSLGPANLRDCPTPDSSLLVALPGSSQTFSDIHVKIVSLHEFICYSMRVLLLRRDSEERTIVHFWYTAWPDHSSPDTTPTSAKHLLELVEAAESCRCGSVRTAPEASVMRQYMSQQFESKSVILSPQIFETAIANTGMHGQHLTSYVEPVDPAGPLVVHCSAGLGRTGCFIALCIGCAQLRNEGMVDVLRIVSRLRLDRGGMVQTNEQYEFIHHALAAFQSCRSPPAIESDTLR